MKKVNIFYLIILSMLTYSISTAQTTGFVLSKDGTKISYTKYGQGKPLVICYGAYNDATDWEEFAKLLSQKNTVYVYDRRGHGKMPNSEAPYTYDTELDDLAAMVRLAGDETAILGHSFGGGVTLAFAIRDKFKGRIILYEPGLSIPNPIGGGDKVPYLKELVAKNELEKATDYAFKEIIQMPNESIEALRKTPIWAKFIPLTKPFSNEVWLLDQLKPTPEQLASLKCRTFILLGSETPKRFNTFLFPIAGALVSHITRLTVYPLIGEDHRASLTNPKLLAEVVRKCLSDLMSGHIY